MFSADFLRNVSTHNFLITDTNHVGDARFFNLAAAQNAVALTTAGLGCAGGFSAAAINCAIGKGATISSFASKKFDASGNPLSGGLDSGYSSLVGFPASLTCGPSGTCLTPATGAAFSGINPNVGANEMLFPIGRSVYNGLQMTLKQDAANPLPGVKHVNLQVAYSFSRYVATARDNDFSTFATDFANPTHYIGPIARSTRSNPEGVG